MRLLSLVFLTACLEGGQGTAVGNPGKIELAAANTPGDIELTELQLLLTDGQVLDCDGIELPLEIPDEPLSIQTNDSLEIPGGVFCALELDPSRLVILGETSGATNFNITFDASPITYDTPFAVDGDALLLSYDIALLVQSGEAIDAADIDGDGQVLIGTSEQDGPDEDTLPTDPVFDAELWSDVDADGTLGPGDTPPPSPGCAVTPLTGGALLSVTAGLLLLGARRRRDDS